MASIKPKQRKLASVGNYHLMSQRLGEGSFSKVELANHAILNTKVALKIIRIAEIEDPYVIKNLKREALVMSKLSHPNVVQLHEVCAHTEFFCLAMDFYAGGTLCDLVSNSQPGRLEENVSKLYYHQLLSGLHHIHQKNVIHRDIKLENVFLNRDRSKAVIGDFGLSNLWSLGGNLKTRCGSAEYAAPELLDKRQQYGPSIDIWSSGVVLFAMVTGQLPFNAEESNGKVTKLFDHIKLGLGGDHTRTLDSVSASAEVRMLLNQVLTVAVSQRVTIPQALSDAWFQDIDPIEVEARKDLDLTQQLKVAKMVKGELKLLQSPEQILSYVKSAKGKFGKTAGCYSLIARDLRVMAPVKPKLVLKPSALKVDYKAQSSPTIKRDVMTIIKKDLKIRSRSPVMTPIQDKLDNLLKKQPTQTTFWETRQGKSAVFALAKLKEDQTKNDGGSGEVVVFQPPPSQKQDLKSFFKPERITNWRRSVKPAPGSQRQGRLKRVDYNDIESLVGQGSRKPLGSINPNVSGK